jgi:hypothetical protein
MAAREGAEVSVKVVIATPPSVANLTQVKTYTPKKTTVASPIYSIPPVPEKSVASPSFSNLATVVPSSPSIYCYLRNNRLVGNFSTAQDAQDAMDFHVQRENEMGADI